MHFFGNLAIWGWNMEKKKISNFSTHS